MFLKCQPEVYIEGDLQHFLCAVEDDGVSTYERTSQEGMIAGVLRTSRGGEDDESENADVDEEEIKNQGKKISSTTGLLNL